MKFSPIAIVGRSCILPGALNPQQLWDVVSGAKDCISNAPEGRWRVSDKDILAEPGSDSSNRSWSKRGGYVKGFEDIWDPSGFAIDSQFLKGLDPLFHWALHCAREALADAGDNRRGAVDRSKVSAVFGNLGFPSSGLTQLAESFWHKDQKSPDPLNRFMSGGAAAVLESALGLAPGVSCLDTACASSLYAIKLACDQLHDGKVDMALAGAVNRADDLFIHVGFTALKAMSPSGQSRPFNAAADGLVPAEGAGFLALKRLSDARRDGNQIHGIIRGIGLSNDGRGRGFLAPCEKGQIKALKTAYDQAQIDPKEVSLIECHATGTTVGDATELRSSAKLFEDCKNVPIASLKSNMGHLITAAGVAGIIKVIEAIKHQKRPPSLHVDTLNPQLEGSPFRVLNSLENWSGSKPKIAAVSAFGFGGNNAHLLLSENDPSLQCQGIKDSKKIPLALVGAGSIVGQNQNLNSFRETLLKGKNLVELKQNKTQDFEIPLKGLKFPPKDLKNALPQQLLLLKAALEAMEFKPKLSSDKTAVFVAMEPDVEVCRFGLRWRLIEKMKSQGLDPKEHQEFLENTQQNIIETLNSAGVVGNMPNIPANRLNSQFDFGGGSFSISAGEASGLRSLAEAHRALSHYEIDAALVGAVDLSCQGVHEKALSQIEGYQTKAGDSAVALLVKRLEDAKKDGDQILAVLNDDANAQEIRPNLNSLLGRSWAAGDLRDLLAQSLSLSQGCKVGEKALLKERAKDHQSTVGTQNKFNIKAYELKDQLLSGPRFHVFAAEDKEQLIKCLDNGFEAKSGPCKLVILAHDKEQFTQRKNAAKKHILQGFPKGPGVYFREKPIEGDLAFVFSGAGSAYEGMGHPLLQALPSLGQNLAKKCSAAAKIYNLNWPEEDQLNPLQRLWSASALCQIHADFSQNYLGLKAQAMIGYSSGESNSLFASGIWNDFNQMIEDPIAKNLFNEEIGGKMLAVEKLWGKKVNWQTWVALAPVEKVQKLVDQQQHVYVSVIHSDNECIVAGDAEGCAKIAEQIGSHRFQRLYYDLAVHVPELAELKESWLELHRREVKAQNIRIYSAAHGGVYQPSKENCAQAILAQAENNLDFRKVIQSAYNDGVRVFVEHGPQSSLGRWIGETLAGKDVVIVSLDRKGAGLSPIFESLAALICAGMELNLDDLLADNTFSKQHFENKKDLNLKFLAHRPEINIPAFPEKQNFSGVTMQTWQTMQPAPKLSPISEAEHQEIKAEAYSTFSKITEAEPSPTKIHTTQPEMTLVEPENQGFNDQVIQAIHQQITELGASNQAYIAKQTELYKGFLKVQNQGLKALMNCSLEQTESLGFRAESGLQTQVETQVEKPISPTKPKVKAPENATQKIVKEILREPKLKAAQAKISSEPKLKKPLGPSFNRKQLEIHSSGKISEIFGDKFKIQDDFQRQVRMPEPPLLLADRITGLDAEAGSMGTGTIWSESDVREDAWYLHQGHMPSGIMIESGQADLMLISYLGVDFTNKNDRVYRLLGCELTYHGGLPKVGDTLSYDIHMDGHATQGDVRLMFFHYDCRIDGQVRLSVRKGQAGFFTDEELAGSDGCLWSAEEVEPLQDPRLDPAAIAPTKNSFSLNEIKAFAAGRPWDCFGPGFERSLTHTRTPRIQKGKMMLLGPITDFDMKGGPWARGYMKSVFDVEPDNWFFDGHFKNDPCMPGTLMFEGCIQLMSFYLSALGYTVKRDGSRFELKSGMPFQLSCRGQVTPKSKKLSYELFVQECWEEPIPTLVADLLCTVDGLKAFHAHKVILELNPAWPLDQGSRLLENYSESKEVAKAGDFPFDYRSLIACANGRPSEAFGPIYQRFDGPGRVARLPNPPYHFLSRVIRTKGQVGSMEEGMEVDVEYDIPSDAWYFEENGCRAMPFAVLLEAALQPCGWLASYLGCALTTDKELCFRNLDGKGTLHVDLLADSGTLLTKVKSTGISRTASMIIVSFKVECFIDKTLVYDLETVFGFFPQSALENQVGLPISAKQKADFEAKPMAIKDFTQTQKADWSKDRPKLAEPMLLMLDRISHFNPEGGSNGLGFARGEKDVNPAEWFFKAHFFQDPVQPGSLGIEAMIQLLQWTMLEKGLDQGIQNPRFETLGLGEEMTWKYRGQVIPENKLISSTLDIVEIKHEENGVLATCEASLWVDGKRIYEASNLGMRIFSGGPEANNTFELNPQKDTWLKDHCPTWTLPALPMMSIVDLLAAAASKADPVISLKDVRIKSWITLEKAKDFRTERSGEHIRLLVMEKEGVWTELASAKVFTGHYQNPEKAFPALKGEKLKIPYETGELFHGPAFEVLESLIRTKEGASSILNAESAVPFGTLNPALLDGATHGIPHDNLQMWNSSLDKNKVAYPALIPEMNFYRPMPKKGKVRCEVRPDGFLATIDYPAFKIQLIAEDGLICSFRLVEACFDKGEIGKLSAMERRNFLKDKNFVAGASTSRQTENKTLLRSEDLAQIDWLPGTVKAIYNSDELKEIAEKEHIAKAHEIHPAFIPEALALHRFDLKTETESDKVMVSGDGRGKLCLKQIQSFWSGWFNHEPWLVEDLYYGLIERFVGRVVLEDPEAFKAMDGRSLLYLGNHQVGIESLLFSVIASGLNQVPTVTLAKEEHRKTWLGKLIAHCFNYPGIKDPMLIAFFDRQNKSSLPMILQKLASEMAGPGRSVMVHVEGTRSFDCTEPVKKMSGAFLDMALKVNTPVVPVRFVGGLPRTRLEQRIEFPIGMGKQDIYIGRPIMPKDLAQLNYGDRKKRVMEAINNLGPKNQVEQPFAGDGVFAKKVADWQQKYRVSEEHAVLGCVLNESKNLTKESSLLLQNNKDFETDRPSFDAWLKELSKRILGD